VGRAEELRIGKASGAAILDEATLGAVRDWRFVPARQGSEATTHWVDVPVRSGSRTDSFRILGKLR